MPQPYEAPTGVPRAASAPPLDTRGNRLVHGYPGYLGSTSHSYMFNEDLKDLGVSTDYFDAAGDGSQLRSISNDRIERGVQVLSFLKQRHMINRFIARWYELSEGTGVIIIETIMKNWSLGLWLRWGNVLAEQDPAKLRRLSGLLFRNTQTPLQYDGTISPKNWINLGTGQNIRWEVIGCIAAMVGLCMRTLDPSDIIFKEYKVNRTKISLHMMDVADECVAFCRECETLDDMFLWLLMEKYPLTSTIKGQGSTWTDIGGARIYADQVNRLYRVPSQWRNE